MYINSKFDFASNSSVHKLYIENTLAYVQQIFLVNMRIERKNCNVVVRIIYSIKDI